ncbi:MAG: hypothetical protein QXZ25_06880 [Candidatus Bathyarchaeia archaeon]
MKELIQALMQDVEETEANRLRRIQREREEAERRERLKLERLEAVQLRRLMEERKRKEKEYLAKKLQAEMEESIKKVRAQRLLEYLDYYERYHQIKRLADELGEQLAAMGVSWLQVEALKRNLIELCMKDWPQPFKSKCAYTEMEKLAFLIDPLQSAMWTNLLPP